MSKFVGGLVTGSVLTLVGIGIAAALTDSSETNPFNAWDIISVDDDDTEEDSDESKEEDSPDTEDTDENTEKSSAYGILGASIAALFNAVAAGAESFEKTLSEEMENSDESEASSE